MKESFGELLIAILEDIRKETEKNKEEQAERNKTEKHIEMLDRDITFGLRERICNENSCGLTACPLWVGGNCIGNHSLKGVKVKIPARIIDAEAEDREG